MHGSAPYLTKIAQKLRREMTKQERHLWYDFLRDYNLQFKRQVPVEKYVLDFYCPRAGLAVEIDGTQHYEPEAQQADEERTAELQRHGIMVVRYDNIQIDRSFGTVCEEIDRIVRERLQIKKKRKAG